MPIPMVFAWMLPVLLFLVLWALCATPLEGVVKLGKFGAKSWSAWLARSRVGKWLSRRTGHYAPILLVLVAGGIAVICAGFLFIALSEQISLTTSVAYRADQLAHEWVSLHRSAGLTSVFGSATNLGSSAALASLVAIVAGILLLRKERASTAFLIVTVILGASLNLGLKMIYSRVRPDLASALAVARWYSFPSGHAMDSFITFGALAYLALRQPWPWAGKSAGLAVALTCVIFVSASRVYLGVHWASDIVGAWSAGTVWLAFSVIAFEMLLRLRQRERGAVPTSPVVDVPDKPAPDHPAHAVAS